MHDRPKARIDGLLSEWVVDELVIYDELSQTAHCLSAQAASVRDLCDGRRSCDEIAQLLTLGPAAVKRAVSELYRSGLLDDGATLAGVYSRRDATVRLAKVGGAALMAPLIYSVAIGPATAAASSCVVDNSPEPGCTATSGQTKRDARCCSGNCYNAAGTKTCAFFGCVVVGGICVPGLNQCCAGPNHCSAGFTCVA